MKFCENAIASSGLDIQDTEVRSRFYGQSALLIRSGHPRYRSAIAFLWSISVAHYFYLMNNQHILFVCTSCAGVWKDGQKQGQSGGEKLLEEITRLHQEWSLRDEFRIQAVDCMSACSQPCTVSFAAQGKWTYIFSNLEAQESANCLLEYASKYYAKTDGLVRWPELPNPLKKALLAKVPAPQMQDEALIYD